MNIYSCFNILLNLFQKSFFVQHLQLQNDKELFMRFLFLPLSSIQGNLFVKFVQFDREHILVFFRKFRVVSVRFETVLFVSVVSI